MQLFSSKMTTFMSYLLPDNISKQDIRQTKRLIQTSFVAIIACFVYSPIYFLLGHFIGGLIIIAGAPVAFINLFFLKKSGNYTVCCHVPTIIYYTTMVGLAFFQDGINSTTIAWFIVTPLIALFTTSIFVSIFWGILSSLTITLFYIAYVSGIQLPQNPLSPDSMVTLLTIGSAGLIIYVLGFSIANEVSKNTAYATLYKMANTDMLTGINNRRHFFEIASNMFENEEHLFAVMLDIDNFKLLNDQYGHPAGDEALKVFANTISSMLLQDEVFGRLGGEEFALLIIGTEEENIKQQIDEMRKKIASQVVTTEDHHKIKFTVSSGIAKKTADLSDIDNLLKKADDALYQAKKSGRNRVVFRV
jgi:diguanylate cyclase (GGDEF)-like protein